MPHHLKRLCSLFFRITLMTTLSANAMGDAYFLASASETDLQGVAIAAGNEHTVVLKSDGTVWAWGNNAHGQLGDTTIVNRSLPMKTSGLSGIIAIAAGGYHTLALKTDGTVWAFGDNEYGQLGNSPNTDRSAAVQVKSLTNVIAIAAGGDHSVALKNDGTVWAWGWNDYGQLGNNTTTATNTPVQVVVMPKGYLTDVIAISAGNAHTVALKNDGTVWAWGSNTYGQLGNGSQTDQKVPVAVSGLSGITTTIVAGWDHSVVLQSDGTVWAWGNNEEGPLGDGTTTGCLTPVQVSNLQSGVVNALSAGWGHTIALKTDGMVWAWSNNTYGQCGDAVKTHRMMPTLVGNLGENISAVAAGSQHTVAIGRTGKVWAWGSNRHGQLGDHSPLQQPSPVQISKLSDITLMAAGSAYTIALKGSGTSGTLWAWGANEEGQLGDGTMIDRVTPVQVLVGSINQIAVGARHTLMLKGDTTVQAWGANEEG